MVSGIDMLVGAIENVDEEHEFIVPDKGLFKRMSVGKENHIIMEDSIKGLKSKQLRQLEDLLYEIEDAGFTVGIPQEEIDKLLESLRIDEK